MRGDLRIFSSRAPFQRAGLAWADTRTPVEISIVDLDGDRFLRIVREPLLRIEGQADDRGVFEPLPVLPEDLGPDKAQMMIDAIRQQLPERPAEEKVFTVADALAERDALQAKLDAADTANVTLTRQLGEAKGEIARLNADLTKATAAVTAAETRATAAEGNLVEASAKAPKATTAKKTPAAPETRAAG